MSDDQKHVFDGEMEHEEGLRVAAAAEVDARAEAETLHFSPPRHLRRNGIGAAVVLLGIVAVGLASRLIVAEAVGEWTTEQAVPMVKTIVPSAAKDANTLVLPGTIQAYYSAPIYAQVSGTVLQWFVDIGTPVKAGQILAQIDPRSYQAALDQVRGTLSRDNASLINAKQDLVRYQSLAAQNAVSSQQLQTQRASVDAGSGLVEADRAAVNAASINLSYTRIVAPFDGVVTSRSVDIGALVSPGNGSANPLFTVSDQTKVRLYVRVPQNNSAAISPGATASFTVPEYPGRVFTASVQSSSGVVDAASGSVLVQLQADNNDGLLKPGAYAEVTFVTHGGSRSIQLPASVLIFRGGGTVLALVGSDNKVIFRAVKIARDNGTTVNIASGVGPTDRVIDNPPDWISHGDKVRFVPKGG